MNASLTAVVGHVLTGPTGCRAAAPDEDSITLAAQVVRHALDRTEVEAAELRGLAFASCSPVFATGNAALVAEVLGADPSLPTLDLLGSRTGWLAALDRAPGLGDGPVVVVAAEDGRRAGEDGRRTGGAVAALLRPNAAGLTVGAVQLRRSVATVARQPWGGGPPVAVHDVRLARARGPIALLREAGWPEAGGVAVIDVPIGRPGGTDTSGTIDAVLPSDAAQVPMRLVHALRAGVAGGPIIAYAYDFGSGWLRLPFAVSGDVVVELTEGRGHAPEVAALPEPVEPPGAPSLRNGWSLRLEGAECRTCGALSFPSRTTCIDCGGTDLGPRPVPRAGRVFAMTTPMITAIQPEPPGQPLVLTALDGVAGNETGYGGKLLTLLAEGQPVPDRGGRVVLELRRSGGTPTVPAYGYKWITDA